VRKITGGRKGEWWARQGSNLQPSASKADALSNCATRPVICIIAHPGPPRALGYADPVKKPQEVEVKISVASAPKTRALLRAAGFQIHKARIFEQNLVLDDLAGSLRERNLLLRVRTAGKKFTCTFKGKEIPGKHKRREEREFHADNREECLAVFAGLGFTPKYTYEKFRTEFARAEEPGIVTVDEAPIGVVTLDETPIGVFVELEGPARWIDASAKELGFSRADYITASYAVLHAEWCREYGLEARDMKFS
jgi:adenylate cyclase class 2